MAKRSSGVVLIVTLLAWSVNLPALACPAMNSRAAVMAQAGASPAPKPEPSPLPHSCCPAQKVSRSAAQPLHRNCALHANSDANCCSVAANPLGTPLPQILTKPDLLKFLSASAFGPLLVLINLPEPLFALASSPPGIPPSSPSVLRL